MLMMYSFFFLKVFESSHFLSLPILSLNFSTFLHEGMLFGEEMNCWVGVILSARRAVVSLGVQVSWDGLLSSYKEESKLVFLVVLVNVLGERKMSFWMGVIVLARVTVMLPGV